MTDKNQCYGGFDDTTQQGWGPGYQYACLHNGSNEYTGGNTTWYNYTLASAGTIIDENTTQENPATNRMMAAESICPKGWTLPNVAQTRSIGPNSGSTTYFSIFSPVAGGDYVNGILYSEATMSHWWSNEYYNGSTRYYLAYNDGRLYTAHRYRFYGLYIRCVQAS